MEFAHDVVGDVPGQAQVIHGKIPDHFVSLLGNHVEPVFGVSHWEPEGPSEVQFVHPIISFRFKVYLLRFAILSKHFFPQIFLLL